jgi:hypothetical protein
MKSMDLIKSGWKKGLAAALVAASFSAVPSYAGIVAGGSVPVINQWRGMGVTGLDVSSAATAQVIASIWIDNNTAGGFDLTITATNGGFAKPGSTDITTGNGVPFTALKGDEAATLPADAVLSGAAIAAQLTFSTFVGETVTYTAGTQTAATVDYQIDISGTWAADATLLAGYYTETFTVTMVATL